MNSKLEFWKRLSAVFERNKILEYINDHLDFQLQADCEIDIDLFITFPL